MNSEAVNSPLTVAQVAERAAVSQATVRRWIHLGLLPASQHGTQALQAVLEFLADGGGGFAARQLSEEQFTSGTGTSGEGRR